MPPVLIASLRTHPGRRRENNEDAVGKLEPADAAVRAERGCLYIVADGMGGHAAGEIASNHAVQSILHSYYSLPWQGAEQTLALATQQANNEINAEGNENAERFGMGSTVVAAAVFPDRAVIAHAGDSRAYLLSDAVLTQLTRDHSWVAEHLADGSLTPEQAVDHPNRHIITRNLGQEPYALPDVSAWEIHEGDRLLLCTDGLWGVLNQESIAGLAQEENVDRAVGDLVAAANAAGGPDNIAVALIELGSNSAPPERSGSAVGGWLKSVFRRGSGNGAVERSTSPEHERP